MRLIKPQTIVRKLRPSLKGSPCFDVLHRTSSRELRTSIQVFDNAVDAMYYAKKIANNPGLAESWKVYLQQEMVVDWEVVCYV